MSIENKCRFCDRPAISYDKWHFAKTCREHKQIHKYPDIHSMYKKRKNGCWEWVAGKNATGYGVIGKCLRDGKRTTVRATHEIYKEMVGQFDKRKYELDHLCFNPACVNPEHLEPVTHAENCRRRRVCKLSHAKVKKIKELSKEGLSQTEIAKVFGVNQSVISRVINNICWS